MPEPVHMPVSNLPCLASLHHTILSVIRPVVKAVVFERTWRWVLWRARLVGETASDGDRVGRLEAWVGRVWELNDRQTLLPRGLSFLDTYRSSVVAILREVLSQDCSPSGGEQCGSDGTHLEGN